MKWLPNSIRWRIQLWHGLLLLTVLSGFGITAYHFQYANELRQVDAELRIKHYLLNEQLTYNQDGQRGNPGTESLEIDEAVARELFGLPLGEPLRPEHGPNFMRREAIAKAFANEQSPYYFLLWSRQGEPLDRSPNAPSDHEIPSFESNTRFRNTGTNFEVYGFTPPGECILVGLSNASVQSAMTLFAWRVTGVCSVVLALGLLGGWWMASRAIAPIQAISAAATRIASGHFDDRIAAHETESELGQLCTLLNDTFARLAASIEEQQRFTSDAAHELRTPVAVILAQTQLALSRKRDAGPDQKTIEMTRRSAERMHSLIESLLELAKTDAKSEIHLQQCQLDAISQENIDHIRPLAEARGISLHDNLSPALCQAHSEHVSQILTNLLTNAVKYCRPGDQIRVSTHRQNGHAVVTVADTGPGIAPEHLPHLFERFYRADVSRNRNTGGAGLGLAICKSLAEAQGGHIRVESELERGTTFEIMLLGIG